MNNSGFLGSLGYVMLLFFFMVAFAGSLMFINGTSKSNIPYDKIVWNQMNYSGENKLVNLTYVWVNAFGYTAMEVAKEGILYGYNHADINWKLLTYLVLIAIISPIIIMLIKLLVLIGVLINEFRHRFKDKNRLKRLEVLAYK